MVSRIMTIVINTGDLIFCLPSRSQGFSSFRGPGRGRHMLRPDSRIKFTIRNRFGHFLIEICSQNCFPRARYAVKPKAPCTIIRKGCPSLPGGMVEDPGSRSIFVVASSLVVKVGWIHGVAKPIKKSPFISNSTFRKSLRASFAC